jgi:hypothetical protein
MTTNNFWRRSAQAGMVAGPGLLVIANLIGANQTGTDEQTLAWATVHRSSYLASSVLVLVGFGLLMAVGARLATALTGRGALLGMVGGTFYLIGAFATLVTNAVYLLNARLITLPGVDPAAALFIKTAGDQDGGVGLFVMFTPLLEVGVVLLAVGLALEHLVPVAGAAALGVGALAAGAAEIAGAGTGVLVAALLVMFGGFVVTAVCSDDWDERVPSSRPTSSSSSQVRPGN